MNRRTDESPRPTTLRDLQRGASASQDWEALHGIAVPEAERLRREREKAASRPQSWLDLFGPRPLTPPLPLDEQGGEG